MVSQMEEMEEKSGGGAIGGMAEVRPTTSVWRSIGDTMWSCMWLCF